MSYLDRFVTTDANVLRWQAETENASARRELALIDRRASLLISQHNPVSEMGIDRDVLALIIRYVRHGDEERLKREFEETRKR